jgi:hypothetical protein
MVLLKKEKQRIKKAEVVNKKTAYVPRLEPLLL